MPDERARGHGPLSRRCGPPQALKPERTAQALVKRFPASRMNRSRKSDVRGHHRSIAAGSQIRGASSRVGEIADHFWACRKPEREIRNPKLKI